jgi:L-2-hydroxyglutarate oxidase
MIPTHCDVAVIGGGIVGLATAMALTERTRAMVVVLEAEDRLAAHQTGHNSGVIHSGLYYKPGSLKAQNCVAGREALYHFCAAHGIAHERCGKVVIAVDKRELPRLDELELRGRANGLQGLRHLGPEEIREHEPHARGIAGLFVPDTGIVDYTAVSEACAGCVRAAGGTIVTGARVTACRRDPSPGGTAPDLVLETARGVLRCGALVNCAGLHSDRVARLCGVEPDVRIVPFRGEYYDLVPQKRGLVRNLIYPLPDPRFPFLGVHFTRMVRGGVEAGPNAVLALKREGYGRTDFSLHDAAELFAYTGFWRMGLRHWRMGLHESLRSTSTGAFVAALRRLVPEITSADVVRSGAGVRAQALGPDGKLCDDFIIVEAERMVHVLNAPSPAATAAITNRARDRHARCGAVRAGRTLIPPRAAGLRPPPPSPCGAQTGAPRRILPPPDIESCARFAPDAAVMVGFWFAPATGPDPPGPTEENRR